MISWLPSAQRDVAQIHYYVAQYDAAAARALVVKIFSASKRLVEFPKSGPARPDIAEGFRSLKAGRYMLLYRIIDDGVEIVRVLHARQDLAAAFAAGI